MNRLISVRLSMFRHCLRFACILILSAGLAQQASAAKIETSGGPAVVSSDPLEEINRSITEFNLLVDGIVLRPIAGIYRAYIPKPVRNVIHNFTINLTAPVTLANDLLQGEMQRAGDTSVRFLLNSTIGLAGMFDVANEFGIQSHSEDFGQTLAVWGAPRGMFLVLPFLGPMNMRHAVGRILDVAASPWTWTTPVGFRAGVSAALVVDVRAERYNQLNDIIDNSLDFYAATQSLYQQNRIRLIQNGDAVAGQTDQGTRSHFPELK